VVLDGAVAARAVVGADGANGVVRRALGLPAQPARALAVAIRAYAPVPTALADGQVIVMDAARWPAYAWSFPIGDGRANVGYGAVLRRGPLTRRELLDGLARLLPDVHALTHVRAHHLPLSTARPRQPDGRVVLAGDAASLVNPFTGEGIFYAVASGAAAGRAALLGSGAGRAHRAALQHRLGRHLRHTSTLALAGGSTVAVDAVVRAGRDPATFARLVELGMADGLVSAGLVLAAARQLPAAARVGRRVNGG
jgi:menaquinone-9 beta-reductase